MTSLQRILDGVRGLIPQKWRNPRSSQVLVAGLVVTAVAGCVSLDTAAPPVETLAGGAAPGTLAAGRALYIGRCAKCHSAEPVGKYTAAEWAEILPDMAERTKLTAGETAEVRAYVWAVLRQVGG